MHQLTPQDAVFLSLETPDLPAHIGGLAFLQPTEDVPFGPDLFASFIESRLGPIERFSWRLQEVPFGLDRPYWVHEKQFDAEHHIHSIRLPEPYSHEALSKLVGRIFQRPMDRSRPLWDMTLIEGLPGGRYVLLWRMHHCLMDGTSGAHLAEQLFDISPTPSGGALVPAPGERVPARAVSSSRVFERGLRNATQLPIRQSKLLAKAFTNLSRRDAEAGAENRTADSGNLDAGKIAPPSLVNGVVGGHRGLAWSTVSLDDVKRIKGTLGVTVNDIVLSITGGAMREYLLSKDALPKETMIVSVPCSTRSAGDKSMGNQLRDMPVHWGTNVEGPIERVAAIHAHASRAKAQAKAGQNTDMIGVMSEALLPGVLNLFMRTAAAAGDRLPLPANTVVSNVPMAPIPLYCAGAKIEQVVPISILAPTQGLNVTVLSYCDQLHFGLVHDPEMVPDAWDLAGRIPKQLQDLQAAVDRELSKDADQADPQ